GAASALRQDRLAARRTGGVRRRDRGPRGLSDHRRRNARHNSRVRGAGRVGEHGQAGRLLNAGPDAVVVIFGAAVRPGGRPSTTPGGGGGAAAEFARRFDDPLFLPTGGIGRFGPSEASVMTALLAAHGVPPDRVVLEESGTDTLSSARAVTA